MVYELAHRTDDLLLPYELHSLFGPHRSALAACDGEDNLDGPLNSAERAAWKAFALAPCTTPADVQAKVAYLFSTQRLSDWIDGGVDHQLDLMRSLCLPVSVADPLSLRVNALFSSYVATEAEQTRLGDLGTDDAGKQADALGSAALDIREELFAIRDRSGNADLIAARLMLNMMLAHPWHRVGGFNWNPEAEIDELPLLEMMADQLTGEVRRQAAFALGTIGVVINGEPSRAVDRRAKPTVTMTGRRQRHVAYRNGRNRRVPEFFRTLSQVMEA